MGSRFNISVQDLINNDPATFAAAINGGSDRSGLRTSRSNDPSGTGMFEITMFNISEVLMGVPSFNDPAEVLGSFESIVGATLGGIIDEEDDSSALLPNDLVAKIVSMGLNPFGEDGGGSDDDDDDDDAGGGGGGSGGDGGSGGRIEGDSEQLSPNFNLHEFKTKDGPNSSLKTPPPPASIPALRWLCVNVLEPMRERYGPATITSAYRHLSYNRGVGSGDGSRHIYDNHPSSPAVDVHFARGSSLTWANAARELMGGGGTGVYPGGHVHIDNRPGSVRW